MTISAALNAIETLLTESVEDFKNHLNANTLCRHLKDEFFSIVETFLTPVIEEVLRDPGLLPELKVGAGKMGLRFKGYRPTGIRLLTGKTLHLQSPYFAKAAPKKRPGRKSKKRNGKSGRHFGLDFLGFVARCSMALGSAVVQAALLCPSFDIAGKTLKFHSIDLDVKTIRKITMDLAGRAMGRRGEVSISDADSVDGKTVLACIDGGRLRERRIKRGRRPAGRKRRGYHAEWKEPIRIVVQVLDPDGEISKERSPLYDATMGGVDAAFDLLEKYLRELGVSKADRLVFCCDGARSYWKRIAPLAEKLGVSNCHEVIDYTHAKQNLYEIIDKLPKNTSDKDKNRIIEMWKNLLWEGSLDRLEKEIGQTIRNAKKRKGAFAKFHNYFLKNRNRMRYADFRRLNLPIGSGCVESAIRRVINLRMKSPGSFWKPETAEAMLFLRSQLLSGRWGVMTGNIFKEIRQACSCH